MYVLGKAWCGMYVLGMYLARGLGLFIIGGLGDDVGGWKV